jgi:hypothetical protein
MAFTLSVSFFVFTGYIPFLSSFIFYFAAATGDTSYGDASIISPSYIGRSKRKRKSVKTPCASRESFLLDVDQSIDHFYEKYLANQFIKTKKERDQM